MGRWGAAPGEQGAEESSRPEGGLAVSLWLKRESRRQVEEATQRKGLFTPVGCVCASLTLSRARTCRYLRAITIVRVRMVEQGVCALAMGRAKERRPMFTGRTRPRRRWRRRRVSLSVRQRCPTRARPHTQLSDRSKHREVLATPDSSTDIAIAITHERASRQNSSRRCCHASASLRARPGTPQNPQNQSLTT